jgi:hypothetical protein
MAGTFGCPLSLVLAGRCLPAGRRRAGRPFARTYFTGIINGLWCDLHFPDTWGFGSPRPTSAARPPGPLPRDQPAGATSPLACRVTAPICAENPANSR